MAQNNAAYDLSLFEKKKANVTPLHSKRATKAEKRRQKIQKWLNGTAAVAVSCLVLVVVSLMITSQVKLTEINNAITKQEALYTEALSETKRLESELAAKTSAQSVEEYALSVGLRPMESGQIDYITVTVPEKTVEKQDTLWASIVGAVKAWLN